MKKKIFIAVLLLVATGYVLALCFAGMNMKSDLTYIGGIVGMLIWFLGVVPFVFRKFIKGEKKHDKESVTGGVADNVDVPSSGLHNQDRSGNGGDRSGPVGKPKRSAGHRAKNGPGVV